ncbi:hypothetical protein DFH29DRAFT_943524 [Suillus ampliporus]|nr:hypothetical protein DFH29DRAFT_943524 [Suillus ampliporus]
MRFSSTLPAYIALAAAATVTRPVTSSSVGESNRWSSDKRAIEGWGIVAPLFGKSSQIAGTLSAHTWWDGLHFPHKGESDFWDEVIELGPNIQRYTDELFHHATELYPSEKIAEFRQSVDNVTITATALHQVVFAAAEQSGWPLDVSILEELGDIFGVLFGDLTEMFPPPEEAPGHENRTLMVNAVLSRVEESFLQLAIKYGGNEELLTSYTSPLKFDVQYIVVIIGDLAEQHPDLANVLLFTAIAPLLPGIAAALSPEIGLLLEETWLLRQVLRMVGFGPLGPMKGTAAAWLQRWLFGPIIPKGSWFAALQRLAMMGAKV